MSDEKERATYMNYVAMRQSILGMPMVVGGSTEPDPVVVLNVMGIDFYIGFLLEDVVDGTEFIVEEAIQLGTMRDENLMPGMPPAGGTVHYIFVPTPDYYVLFASLQLDEWANGPSDPFQAGVVWVKRSDRLEHIIEEQANQENKLDKNYFASKILFKAHFNHLFDHITSSKDIDQEFDGEIVQSALKDFASEIDQS